MSRPPALPPEVQAAIARGDLIAALKRMRELQGLGLKEAKALLDAAKSQALSPQTTPAARGTERGGQRRSAPPPAPPKAVHAPPPPPFPPPEGYDPLSGLAPGEQPHRSMSWPLIVFAIGLLVYLLLRR